MASMLATLTTTSISQVTSYVILDEDNDILLSKYVICYGILNTNNFYFIFFYFF